MEIKTIGPCNYRFNVASMGTNAETVNRLENGATECLQALLKDISTTGRQVIVETIEHIQFFEECCANIYFVDHDTHIEILRIEIIR